MIKISLIAVIFYMLFFGHIGKQHKHIAVSYSKIAQALNQDKDGGFYEFLNSDPK